MSHNVYMFFGIYFENRNGENEHIFDELHMFEDDYDVVVETNSCAFVYIGKIIAEVDVEELGESEPIRLPDNPDIQKVGANLMNRFVGMPTLFYLVNVYNE